jgi:uncharacterized protein (TIGR00251 family)
MPPMVEKKSAWIVIVARLGNHHCSLLFHARRLVKHNFYCKMTHSSGLPGYMKIVEQNHILLQVLVKPGSKKPGLVQTTDEAVVLSLHSPPRQGQANEELIERLAKLLHLPKSNISIEAGEKGKKKRVSIQGIQKWQIIHEILQAAAQE